MEIMMPSPPRDFDFNSARSTPFVVSAPSTPKRFGEYYFSAPTSPSRMAEIYCEVNEFDVRGSGGSGYSASIPFGWEEKPGTPKSSNARKEAEADDFAFEFNEGSEGASLSAEELFDGGKIKPLKPPPRLQIPGRSSSSINNNSQSLVVSPKSPRYLAWQETISNNTSGSTSERKKENGPYKEATREAGMRTERERGRDRVPRTASRRVARSLSPYRVSTYPWEDEEKQLEQGTSTKQSSLRKPTLNSPNQTASSSKAAGSGSGSGSKKWRLKDFLLFRSASEGRATDTDPFRKYAAVFRKQEDIKNSSVRAADGSGSISRRKSGPISAHELHYTVNKAVSEDLKKRTFLPYKQGILGRLAFNPAVHALANGFGSLYR